MKNIIFLLIITVPVLPWENNPTKSDYNLFDDSDLSDSSKYLYQLDAYRLALRDMKENDENFLFEYEILKELYQNYYNGIIVILNSEYVYGVDTMQNIQIIHTFPYPTFNEIRLVVDVDSIFYSKICNENLQE